MKKILKIGLCLGCIVGLSGCMTGGDEEDKEVSVEEVLGNMEKALGNAESFSGTTLFQMDGTYQDTDKEYKAVVLSEVNEEVYLKNMSIHSETYSKMTVNDKIKSETLEEYYVPLKYGDYDYYYLMDTGNETKTEWVHDVIGKKEASGVKYEAGLIKNWKGMKGLSLEQDTVQENGQSYYALNGKVDKGVIADMLCGDIFGGFYGDLMRNVGEEAEMNVKVHTETFLPAEIEINMNECVQMTGLNTNLVTLTQVFHSFGKVDDIHIPKKVSITSIEKDGNNGLVNNVKDLFEKYINNEKEKKSGE